MINLNGTLLENSKAIIALDNRGLNYGDAVFACLHTTNNNSVYSTEISEIAVKTRLQISRRVAIRS